MQSPGQALKPTHVKGMFGELLLLGRNGCTCLVRLTYS
jgi:hypothetical protein